MFYDYTFLFLFLPLVLIAYYALPGRFRNGWLFLSSLVFYGLYHFRFFPVLILSAFVNYFLGLTLAGSSKKPVRQFWLAVSLLLNLGTLVVFKYSLMLSETIREIPAFNDFPLVKYALPLGISFYTFKNISYLVDIYRGHIGPARSLIDYSMYLSFFPQIPSGPIMRFKEIAGQLRARVTTSDRISQGIQLFFMGASKKILLADTAAYFCNPLFALPTPGFWQSWASVLLYSAQIYFDFSGYTDMAIGLALLFGIESPQNFNSPYKSHSFAQFWRRWHMTLSFWLRDYLYISMGGNRNGKFRTYLNLVVTMLLGGLWHGASWNFLVWGGYHGLLLAIERYLGVKAPQSSLAKIFRIIFNFLMVSIGWVFFRCADFSQSWNWLKSMFLLQGLGPFFSVKAGAAILILLSVIFGFKNSWEMRGNYRLYWILFIVGCFILSLVIAYTKGAEPVIYARF